MTEAKNKSLNKRFIGVFSFALSFAVFLGFADTGFVSAQEGMQAANTQTIVMEVVPEPGCPVEITGARTELGFDSFGLPVFGKTYIDYKNGGEKAINAVKFRVRYTDQDGQTRGTFHGNDEAFVPQGGLASGKFAHYKLRSNIHKARIRVLAIKFSDGSTWESARMKDIQKAQQEGKEVEVDDEPTASPPVQAAPAEQAVSPAKAPVEPTSQPVLAPTTTAAPEVKTPETAAPTKEEPLTATPQTMAPPAEASAKPATSEPVSPEPAKQSQMVEEVPLSATPKAMPLNKNSDPFSSQ